MIRAPRLRLPAFSSFLTGWSPAALSAASGWEASATLWRVADSARRPALKRVGKPPAAKHSDSAADGAGSVRVEGRFGCVAHKAFPIGVVGE
ncbi:hypothetical protein SCWH03_56900 [Streptomyces pacificus]|uniref:Secreted protein n=1 Tax=Streptomyces pacificus TaxID=2705029 RepID=A0A6A0B3Y9_9ACTN|nr:hypothetical protein SCWH03_56900 [Streptomyces pacificus]